MIKPESSLLNCFSGLIKIGIFEKKTQPHDEVTQSKERVVFMLESLCGNKNVQKILLFLLVNGKCYGTQLQRALGSPLTPLQKALLRLERGGIILSEYEGKTRLYQFDPSYPLLPELQQLLKKAYTLLSPQDKRFYCSIDLKVSSNLAHHQQTVLDFWQKLSHVTQLKFTAKTRSLEEGGWNGRGQGEVTVIPESSNILIFQEKGSWVGKEGAEIAFSNSFRWVLDRQTGMISLEHLRRGLNHPVFLFHLAPANRHTLTSVDSHMCADDTYFGQLISMSHCLRLKWRVIGPKKNEEMDYYYTAQK